MLNIFNQIGILGKEVVGSGAPSNVMQIKKFPVRKLATPNSVENHKAQEKLHAIQINSPRRLVEALVHLLNEGVEWKP